MDPYAKLTDLFLTSLEHVGLLVPRVSLDKTGLRTSHKPVCLPLQKVSRWKERLMLSEQSLTSHLETTSIYSAEKQCLPSVEDIM